ncbi:hypothetical protein CHUAL_008168 [Chamberlinius hualienensis]
MDIDVVRKQLEEAKTLAGDCMFKVDDNISEMIQLKTDIQDAVDKKHEPTEQITKFQLLVTDSKKQIYKTKLAIANARLSSLDFQSNCHYSTIKLNNALYNFLLTESKGRTWITMIISSVFHLEMIACKFCYYAKSIQKFGNPGVWRPK